MKEAFSTSVLDKKRIKLLKDLEFLNKYEFYLAGGTALAIQIGHRTSLDMDFYTKKEFDTRKLIEDFNKRFEKVQEIYIAENTLSLEVNDIEISFFKYQYSLVKPLKKEENIFIASLEDIAAMKIIAISQRGIKRDFIDIYFLMRFLGLNNILELTKKKYPSFNIYVGLQGIVYFKDADNDIKENRFQLLKRVNWQEVKDYILEEVRKVKKLL